VWPSSFGFIDPPLLFRNQVISRIEAEHDESERILSVLVPGVLKVSGVVSISGQLISMDIPSLCDIDRTPDVRLPALPMDDRIHA
jgi:hypothetical protein